MLFERICASQVVNQTSDSQIQAETCLELESQHIASNENTENFTIATDTHNIEKNCKFTNQHETDTRQNYHNKKCINNFGFNILFDSNKDSLIKKQPDIRDNLNDPCLSIVTNVAGQASINVFRRLNSVSNQNFNCDGENIN